MRLLIVLLSLTVAGCKTGSSASIAKDRAMVEKELGGETSLKEDRSELDKLRKDVPPETQKQNDELALFLNLMKQGREQPQDVRGKFQSLVQKRRS
jgi:hypothetical protein